MLISKKEMIAFHNDINSAVGRTPNFIRRSQWEINFLLLFYLAKESKKIEFRYQSYQSQDLAPSPNTKARDGIVLPIEEDGEPLWSNNQTENEPVSVSQL